MFCFVKTFLKLFCCLIKAGHSGTYLKVLYGCAKSIVIFPLETTSKCTEFRTWLLSRDQALLPWPGSSAVTRLLSSDPSSSAVTRLLRRDLLRRDQAPLQWLRSATVIRLRHRHGDPTAPKKGGSPRFEPAAACVCVCVCVCVWGCGGVWGCVGVCVCVCVCVEAGSDTD